MEVGVLDPIPGELRITTATAFLIAYVSCKTIIELYNFGKLVYKFYKYDFIVSSKQITLVIR
jgi:hypothetical protein